MINRSSWSDSFYSLPSSFVLFMLSNIFTFSTWSTFTSCVLRRACQTESILVWLQLSKCLRGDWIEPLKQTLDLLSTDKNQPIHRSSHPNNYHSYYPINLAERSAIVVTLSHLLTFLGADVPWFGAARYTGQVTLKTMHFYYPVNLAKWSAIIVTLSHLLTFLGADAPWFGAARCTGQVTLKTMHFYYPVRACSVLTLRAQLCA